MKSLSLKNIKKKNNKYYSQHHSLYHSISEDYDISVRKINLDNSTASCLIDYNTNNEHIFELLDNCKQRPYWLYDTKIKKVNIGTLIDKD